MKLKNIKDTFDNREIKPSASSWDALSSRLDEEEKKSKKPVIYWLSAIAAILIAAVLLYPSLDDSLSVDTVNDEVAIIDDPTTQEVEGTQRISNAQESISQELLPIEVKEAIVIQEESYQNAKQVTPVVNEVVSQSSTRKQEKDKKATSIISNPKNTRFIQIEEPLIENKVNTTVVIVDPTSTVKKPLTADEEMEFLLNKAMNKVEVTSVASKTVDPNKLLRETEWDIESDNQSRLQNGIQNGLNFLKAEAVAIVDRK